MLLIVTPSDTLLRPWLDLSSERSGGAPIPTLQPGDRYNFAGDSPRIVLFCVGHQAEGLSALRRLPDLHELQVLLQVGGATGLRAGTALGDLLMVTATSEFAAAPGTSELPPQRRLPDAILTPLRSRLAELQDRMAQGGLLSITEPVFEAQAKARLGSLGRYLAADLQACLLRDLAEEQGAVYAGVMSITDLVDHDGAASPTPGLRGRFAQGMTALRSPGELLKISRQLRGERRAAQAISRAVPAALGVLEPHACV